MGIISKLFGGSKEDHYDENEHCVIVHFNYGLESMDQLYNLRDKLETVLEGSKVGEYDGHEIATDLSDGFLYLYGPNAEDLYKIIQPTIETTDFMKGASVRMRFGPPEDGVKEIEIKVK